MKAILYSKNGHRGCDIIRDRLNKHNINFVEKNLYKVSINEVDLKHILDRCDNGFEDIISKRSIPYKRISDVINDMKYSELFQFILDNQEILRTPIVYTKRDMLIGYQEDTFEEFMKELTNNL